MSPKTLGLITARSGSKGLPNKHLLDLGGKPLIAWTVLAAREAAGLDAVIVSTDSAAISDVARAFGAEAPFLRPAALAQDSSPHIDVVVHALDWLHEQRGYEPDFVVLLQPTSPFRDAADIDGALAFCNKKQGTSVISVSPAPVHPFFTFRMDDTLRLVPYVDPPPGYLPRQQLPDAWQADGAIFLQRVADLRSLRTFYPARSLGYRMPPGHGIQIDSAEDLERARHWVERSR